MQRNEMDIFDKIMYLPAFKIIEPFYSKHKEVLLYLLFGGLSFVLNIGLYILINGWMRVNELVANVFCWVACVLFQYVTNRTWVFDGKTESRRKLFLQIATFFGGRIFTLFVEEGILAIFITYLGFNSIAIKLIAQVVVIILNYVISKLIVFGKRKNDYVKKEEIGRTCKHHI